MDIKELAEHARSFFESKTRQGTEEEFYILKRRHPQWLHDMMFKIHDNGDVFPDDYKYEYAVDSLDLIADGVDPEDPQLEPDVYTSDLLKWFSSHAIRISYVDEAAEEMEHSKQGIMGDIAQGQWREKEEVFRLVVEALQERLQAIEEGIEEEPKQWRSVKDWRPE